MSYWEGALWACEQLGVACEPLGRRFVGLRAARSGLRAILWACEQLGVACELLGRRFVGLPATRKALCGPASS